VAGLGGGAPPPHAGGELIFSTGDGTVLATVPFAAAVDEFLYGSITIPSGAPVTLSVATAPAHLAHLYVYEAPR
jgi:hypothetical protein